MDFLFFSRFLSPYMQIALAFTQFSHCGSPEHFARIERHLSHAWLVRALRSIAKRWMVWSDLAPRCLNRLLVEYLQYSRGSSERFLAELAIRYERGKDTPTTKKYLESGQ
jgi:hypothetical protein